MVLNSTSAQDFQTSQFDDSFFIPGFNEAIEGITSFEDQIIVYGRFTMINDKRVDYIALWDGTNWIRFGESLLNTSGITVVSSASVYNGELYVAGSFNQSQSEVGLNNIAKWDGIKWVAVGEGLDNYVGNLTVYKDELIASGSFRKSGERTVNGVSRWDGVEWKPMDFRVNDLTNISSMSSKDSLLLITGGIEYISSNTTIPEGSFTGSYRVTQLDTAFHLGKSEEEWWLFAEGFSATRTFTITLETGNRQGSDRTFLGTVQTGEGSFSNSRRRLIFSDSTEFSSENVTIFTTIVQYVECDSFSQSKTRYFRPGAELLGSFDIEDDSEFTFVIRDTDYDCDGGEDQEIRFKAEKLNAKSKNAAKMPLIVNNIFMWDGEQVEDFNGGLEGGFTVVATFHNNRVVANTRGSDESGNYFNLIMEWDGHQWNSLGGSFNGIIKDVHSHEGRLLAGGIFTKIGEANIHSIAEWDGSKWIQFGSLNPEFSVDQIHFFDESYIFSVADYEGEFLNNIAFNNNGSWEINEYNSSGKGVIGSVYQAHKGEEGLYIVGPITKAGATTVNNIALYIEEEGYKDLSTGLSNFSTWRPIFQVFEFGGNLVAGGDFQVITEDTLFSDRVMIREDGKWKNMGSFNSTVRRFFEYNDTLFAIGSFSRSGGQLRSGIAKWDSKTWLSVNDVELGWMRDGMVFENELYTVGYSSQGDSALIAKWNGSSWYFYPNKGLPVNSAAKAITNLDEEIYIAYDIGFFEGDGTGNVAKWGGEKWEQIGGEFDDEVSVMINHQGTLVAGGVYRTINGIETSPIVYWNGEEWTGFSDFLSGKVYSLQSLDEGILFGGDFAPQLNFTSNNVGLIVTDSNYNSNEELQEIATFNISGNYPNPFNPSTNIEFSLPVSGNVTVKIFDSIGREIETLLSNEKFGAGIHTIRFNGSSLASGVYFYQINVDGNVETKKMTLVK